ncbi:hypothetical protein THAOC_13994, partial [Thalassiosira oceanica]
MDGEAPSWLSDEPSAPAPAPAEPVSPTNHAPSANVAPEPKVDNVGSVFMQTVTDKNATKSAPPPPASGDEEKKLSKIVVTMRLLNMAAAVLLITSSYMPRVAAFLSAARRRSSSSSGRPIAMNFGFLFHSIYRFLFYILMASVTWSYQGLLGYITSGVLAGMAVFNTFVLCRYPAYRMMRESIAAEEDKRIQSKINQQVRKQAASQMGWGNRTIMCTLRHSPAVPHGPVAPLACPCAPAVGLSRGSVCVRQERREQLVAVDLELVHGRGPVGRPGRRGTRGGVPPQDRAGVDRGLEGADDHAAACLETALAVVHGRQGRVHEGDRGPGVRLGRRVGRGGAGLVGLRDDLVDEGCADEQEEHDRRRHCRGRPGSPYPSGGASLVSSGGDDNDKPPGTARQEKEKERVVPGRTNLAGSGHVSTMIRWPRFLGLGLLATSTVRAFSSPAFGSRSSSEGRTAAASILQVQVQVTDIGSLQIDASSVGHSSEEAATPPPPPPLNTYPEMPEDLVHCMSASEWRQRCELAASYRIAYLHDWHEN